MWGLKFRLEGVYFTTFRKATTTSLILSYSIPPFTTIRGLISNALGLQRDDLQVQEWMKIGIKPLHFSDKSREMAKILKLKGEDDKFTRTFSSSPMFREFLVHPAYEIFLGGLEDKIKKINSSLKNPARPLYIGTSDDLADVVVDYPAEIEPALSNEFSGIVEGVHEDAIVEKLPYKFHQDGKRFSLEYKVVSIPKNGTIHIKDQIEAYRFEDEIVWLT